MMEHLEKLINNTLEIKIHIYNVILNENLSWKTCHDKISDNI